MRIGLSGKEVLLRLFSLFICLMILQNVTLNVCNYLSLPENYMSFRQTRSFAHPQFVLTSALKKTIGNLSCENADADLNVDILSDLKEVKWRVSHAEKI